MPLVRRPCRCAPSHMQPQEGSSIAASAGVNPIVGPEPCALNLSFASSRLQREARYEPQVQAAMHEVKALQLSF